MKAIPAFLSIALFSLLFIGLTDARSQGVCPVNGQIIAGHLDASGPLQNGRIFRDAIPSSCPSKVYPGIFGVGTLFAYQVHEFVTSPSTSCVTVNFDPGSCDTNAHASAYLNSYDPNNQAANYVGDVGASLPQSFSFEVPGGSSLVLVVTNTASAATCDYAFSINNYACTGNVEITLEPETATLTAGEPYTVTALVTSNDQPISGALVSFKVTSGPNTGKESIPNNGECSANNDCTTDSTGQVSWTYTSGTLGIDTVTASVELGSVTRLSDPVEVRWLGRPIPTLSEWGLIAMAGLAGIIGLIALRRKKAAA